jgi:hypothetical protein
LPKFQQVLKEFNAYLVNHKIHDQGFTANNFTYTTTINLGNDFVLTDNSNMLYLRQLKLEPEDDDDFTVNIKHRILSEVIEVMIDAMDMMYQDESLSLDELSLGVITFDNINYKQHTITSAINYCSRVFPNLISQKLQRNP